MIMTGMFGFLKSMVDASKTAFLYYTSARYQKKALLNKVLALDKEIAKNKETLRTQMLHSVEIALLYDKINKLSLKRIELLAQLDKILDVKDVDEALKDKK